LFSGCGSDEEKSDATCGDGTCDVSETTASCAADCPAAAQVCNSDGTCDADENFGNCPADCNTLCAGADDVAYSTGLSGDGSWADTDCAGTAQNNACVGAGMVGAGLACAAGTSSAACGAIGACTWGGDTVGCIATSAATCAGAFAMGGDAACMAAGCMISNGGCLPMQAEANCTAGSAILSASQNFECTWNSDVNLCWYPKTGSEVASGAASDCGLACLSNADPVTCTLECMLGADKLGPDALTTGCMTCYAAVLDCTLNNCVLPCSAISAKCDNQCSDECFTALTECGSCRTDKGCDAVFNACASGSN